MREHAHLAAMVGFVRKHVAQHFHADRPRLSPAISSKLLDASTTVQRFSQHLRATSGALGQSRTRLLWRAVHAVELWWNFQVRSCKPDPLTTDIVHVREDGRNGADPAGRLGSPSRRVKIFDKHLVDAIIGRKDLDCGSADLRLNLVLFGRHGACGCWRPRRDLNPCYRRERTWSSRNLLKTRDADGSQKREK